MWSAAAGAQVFTSGFETWNDTVPAEWMGSKTSLSADSVTQVTTDVHGGTFAVRLQNSTTSHRRFTTQPVPVTNGAIYDVTYWVRGTGEIRTGLFDDRPSGGTSGYAPYTNYFVSTGNTWTQVTQQISAANDFASAEFILSVRSTAGPEHLVVDDVTITEAAPPEPVSIYAIQFTADPGGASPLAGQIVTTGGIVTAVDTIGADSYFIQSGTGPWTGIYVNDATNAVALGDSVIITASVEESFQYTRLTNVTSFAAEGGFAVPAAEVLTPNQANEEQWEGVLVKVPDIGCTALPDNFGEWIATSTTGGSMMINDLLFAYTPTVGTFYTITGVMNYSFNARKLEPRFLADIEFGSGVAEQAQGALLAYPNPSSGMVRLSGWEPNGSADFSVTDAGGRLVLSGALMNPVADLTGLPDGAYTLSLRTAKSVFRTRVVVQR